MKFAYLLLSFLASASAFTVLPQAQTAPKLTPLSLMAPDDVDSVLSKAEDCSEGECSVDEVSELLSILKGQQKELYSRVQTLKETIYTLEHVNEKDAREVDEVRETVRAIYRIFQLGDKASGNDYPSLSKPTGWSGEIGDGPKTAYDALPPKKWKASK
ncbi:expressed unknown protein [Seminavis robusta]|uniref:Uncharacterized protein n=1 Tax=Seminavis robusta TaxID=568900 RepID=A0A9N8HLT0_9STRA|nr:expressed unknown protein [Seminavis robusta]|eukprot:Sro850_g210710.1 n/a (158) ;mRNA; f:27698-28326